MVPEEDTSLPHGDDFHSFMSTSVTMTENRLIEKLAFLSFGIPLFFISLV